MRSWLFKVLLVINVTKCPVHPKSQLRIYNNVMFRSRVILKITVFVTVYSWVRETRKNREHVATAQLTILDRLVLVYGMIMFPATD